MSTASSAASTLPATYKQQPDYLDPDPLAVPRTATPGAGVLEFLPRLITYIEDPEIGETALQGPDTATRLKTIAQVKVLFVPEQEQGVPPVTCQTAGNFLPQPGNGTLTTLPPDDAQPDDPCRLPDPALYTGRENRTLWVPKFTTAAALANPTRRSVAARATASG